MPVQQQRRRLGEAIRARRKEAGLTQEKLAERADLSPVFISHIECGIGNASFDTLVRIANALGVRLRELVADI